jgi:hypothetical protein
MNDAERTTRFVVFCLEAYKRAEALTGRAAAERFARHGVTAYLRDGYDILHTLGEAALVDDIRAYLRAHPVP